MGTTPNAPTEGLTGGQMTKISLPQWIEGSAGTQVPFFEIDSPKADSFRFRLQILTPMFAVRYGRYGPKTCHVRVQGLQVGRGCRFGDVSKGHSSGLKHWTRVTRVTLSALFAAHVRRCHGRPWRSAHADSELRLGKQG